VRFWDSSALAPLIVTEPSSTALRDLAEDRRRIVVWWAAPVECASAVVRRERAGDLDPEGASEALVTLDGLTGDWSEVPPTGRLRDAARRLVRVHDLRAADALQLAAAHAASELSPVLLEFVTLDERLALAARREGFPVLP
jgi:predicted nucleic acid-binding protein